MNRRIVSFISAFIILFSVMSFHKATVEVALGPPPPTTTIFVDSPTSSAKVGQTFVIDIVISDVGDLYGWEFKLGWNSTLLDVVDVTEGSFLNGGGTRDTFFASKNYTDYILVDCTLLGGVSGVSGSGTLATVEFYAEVQGESVLGLYDTTLINSNEVAITHTANNGTVTITDPQPQPVGGIWIPVNKLELLAPYIGLVLAISVAAVATVVLVRRRKKKQ